MIINLLNPRFRILWLVLHILLGAAAVFNNVYVIGWFYLVLLSLVYLLSYHSVNRPIVIASVMVYIGAFELLARMTKCSPIIPWEASKYIFTILSLAGIVFSKGKNEYRYIGYLILLLMLPALIIDESNVTGFSDKVFNLFGIINIGLGLIFFGALRIRKDRLIGLLRLMVYPAITILTFTVIKTPDLKDISFSLGAQVATSGEFGSNQVSTVLGFGFLLMSIAWIMNWRLSTNRNLDGFIAVAFLIQGLFTFSRGGMIGGGLGLLVFLYFILYNSKEKITIPFSIKRYSIPVFIIFIAAIWYTNNLTGGRLLLRYQGETQGTMLGRKDKDLTTLTSNRNLIFFSDLDLWRKYPFLGAGGGASKYIREEHRGTAAHVEISRLLAEQGIPGLIIFMLILYLGFGYLKEKDTLVRAIKLSLFVLAIFTTFHSATRTFITPLLISLCSVGVTGNVKKHAPLPGK